MTAAQREPISRSAVITAFGQLVLGGLAAGIVAYWFTSSVIQATFMGIGLGITVAVITIAMDWTGNLRLSNEKSRDT